MRALALLFLLFLVFAGVAAYDLNQRGLLSRENLELFYEQRQEPEDEVQLPPEPVGLAASVQKKELKLKERTEGLQKLEKRVEAQRRELAAERIAIDKQLEELKSITEDRESAMSAEAAKFIRMYESMAPEEAAAILENLPDSTVAEILFQMRGRRAAQIMESLSPGKAAEVTKLIASQKAEISG